MTRSSTSRHTFGLSQMFRPAWITLSSLFLCAVSTFCGCSKEAEIKPATPAPQATNASPASPTPSAPAALKAYAAAAPADLVVLPIGVDAQDWVSTSAVAPSMESIAIGSRLFPSPENDGFVIDLHRDRAFYRLQQPIEGDFEIQFKTKRLGPNTPNDKAGIALYSTSEEEAHLTNALIANQVLDEAQEKVIEVKARSGQMQFLIDGKPFSTQQISPKAPFYFAFVAVGDVSFKVKDFKLYVTSNTLSKAEELRLMCLKGEGGQRPSIFHKKRVIAGEVPLDLGGFVSKMVIGQDGKTIAVLNDTLRKVQLIDVVHQQIRDTIPAEDPNTLIAIGSEDLILYSPLKNNLTRYSLSDLNNTRVETVAPDSKPVAIALGGSSEGPLLLQTASGQFDFRSPGTLERQTIDLKFETTILQTHLVASTDGQTFVGSGNGFFSITLFGNRAFGFEKSRGVSINPTGARPTPGGQFIFANGRLNNTYLWEPPIENSPELFQIQTFNKSGIPTNSSSFLTEHAQDIFIPSYDDRFVICLSPKRRPSYAGYIDSNAAIYAFGHPTPLLTLDDLDLCFPKWHDNIALRSPTESVDHSQRLQYLPAQNLLVTLPESNNVLVFRPIEDLVAKLKSNPKPSFVYSDLRFPPAVEGQAYEFPPQFIGNVESTMAINTTTSTLRNKQISDTAAISLRGIVQVNATRTSPNPELLVPLVARSLSQPSSGISYVVNIPLLPSDQTPVLSDSWAAADLPTISVISQPPQESLTQSDRPVAQENPSPAKSTTPTFKEDLAQALAQRIQPKSKAKTSSGSKESRQWISSNGKSKIEAAFVALTADGKSVELIKKDDKTITVPLDKLSEADQAWVKDQSQSSSNNSAKSDSGLSTQAGKRKRETVEQLAVDYIQAITAKSTTDLKDCFANWEDIKPLHDKMNANLKAESMQAPDWNDQYGELPKDSPKAPKDYYTDLGFAGQKKVSELIAAAKTKKFKFTTDDITGVTTIHDEQFAGMKRFDHMEILLENASGKFLLTLDDGAYTDRGWLFTGELLTLEPFDQVLKYNPKAANDPSSWKEQKRYQYDASVYFDKQVGPVIINSIGTSEPQIRNRIVNVFDSRVLEINLGTSFPGGEFRTKVWANPHNDDLPKDEMENRLRTLREHSDKKFAKEISYPNSAKDFKTARSEVARDCDVIKYEIPANGVSPKRYLIQITNCSEARMAMFELYYDASISDETYEKIIRPKLKDAILNCKVLTN